MESISTPTVTPATRKRVSQACQLCASKKVKCDGASPKCGPCALRNEDCSYGVSKRRRTNQYSDLSVASPEARNGAAETLAGLAQFTPASTAAPRNHQVARSVPYPGRTASYPGLTVSVEISKRLFQTYFESIHPMWPLLYKPLYTTHDFVYPSPTIPAPLVLAIFAIASCVDRAQMPGAGIANGFQRDANYPEPRVFLEESLSLLQKSSGHDGTRQPVNTFNPSITACQTLVILALQQHGVAEYSRGATILGLATSMAIELNLHRAYEPNDPVEQEVRSRLWWNLYILEKMMAGEMGRPITLRAEDTDCPHPSVEEADEYELMPVRSQGLKPIGQARNVSVKMRTMSALRTTIDLTFIMERVYRQVYALSARKAIRVDQTVGEGLRLKLWGELQQWEKNMDSSELKLDLSDQLSSVPAAITNYVAMWTVTIMLHRPFIARWQPAATPNPAEICLHAANQICLVLEKYLERLPGGPCDMVFSIFITASILLHYAKEVEGTLADETSHKLKLCIHWLSVLGKSWKSAGARHQLLNDLFNLPQALQEPHKREGGFPTMNTIQPVGQPALVANMLAPRANIQPDASPLPAEDWSFLRGFGDATDQFYSWDVELRDLLDAKRGLEGLGFST